MRILLQYEIKKIVMKKSTVVAFVILFAIQIFLAISGSLGSTYANDVFLETHVERNRIDREYGLALSGRAMDDELLKEVQEAYAKVDWSDRKYLLSDVYKDEVRKYAGVIERLKYCYGKTPFVNGTLTEETLNYLREQNRESMQEAYEISENEKAYWQEKDANVEFPFVYEYAQSYESLVNMNGGYMTCMLITFFIAISMVTVFGDEVFKE